MYKRNENQEPTQWVHDNGYFKVSSKGAIGISDKFKGEVKLPQSVTPGTVAFILANLDSFQKAGKVAQDITVERELSKELSGLVARMKALGLAEDVAIQQASEILKKRTA